MKISENQFSDRPRMGTDATTSQAASIDQLLGEMQRLISSGRLQHEFNNLSREDQQSLRARAEDLSNRALEAD